MNHSLLCMCNYSFSRKKVVADQSEHWKMLTQQWHILVAAGRLYESEEKNTTLMSTKFKKATSNCKCNVTACAEKCDCPDGFKYQLLKWHGESLSLSLSLSLCQSLTSPSLFFILSGVLMSLAFIFFIPTGAIISRYYKMVFVSSWFKVCTCTCTNINLHVKYTCTCTCLHDHVTVM